MRSCHLEKATRERITKEIRVGKVWAKRKSHATKSANLRLSSVFNRNTEEAEWRSPFHSFYQVKMHHKKLTKTERQEIFLHQQKGYSARSIAKMLQRSPSTISRELARNAVSGEFQPEKAHAKQRLRRRMCRFQAKKIRQNRQLETFIEIYLQKGWSPEKIAGRWNLENPNSKIAFQRIYEWVRRFQPRLCKCLLRAKDRPKKRREKKTERTLIPERVWIDDRPRVINRKTRTGDFEGDTICSIKGDKTSFLAAHDRKSRLILGKKILNKKGDSVVPVMQGWVKDLGAKSFTLDNGIEFQRHLEFGCPTFFCHPYSSWEKGGVENSNGLIRRFFPKKTRLADVSEEDLQAVIDLLNNMPRKCLGFRTPLEVFFSEVHSFTSSVSSGCCD